MMEAHETRARRQRKEKMFFSFLTAFIFFLGIFLLVGTYRLYRQRALIVREHALLQERLQELQAQNERVEEKLKLLATEEGKRYLMKEYYGFGEEGERIIYLSR